MCGANVMPFSNLTQFNSLVGLGDKPRKVSGNMILNYMSVLLCAAELVSWGKDGLEACT